MKATVTIEAESPEDFVALADLINLLGRIGPDTVTAEVKTEAPAPKPRKNAKADKKPVEKPAEEPAEDAIDLGIEDEPEVEEITKAVVSTDLRAFIKERGEKNGPQLALGVLKKFGANKFDELKPEDYSKFLSALKKVE